MDTFISLGVILIVVLLVTVILIQVKGEAGNLFGGNTSFRTRRGVEKTLFQVTIGLGVLFVILAIVNIRFG